MKTLALESGRDAARANQPRSSRLWLAVGVVAALTAILYGGILWGLVKDCWSDPTISQGILLPPVALYLAWRRRGRLTRYAAPDNRGLFLIALACLCFIVGKLGAEFFLPRISFVMLLAGLVWTFWGFTRLRILALPLILLVATVPLPKVVYNSLATPLQLFASDASAALARMLGITVHQDGNIITLADLSLGVEEACSGLGSLSALSITGILLGLVECSRIHTRILVFVLAIPIALSFNIIRITLTAVLGDYNSVFAMGFYHSFSGWLVFILGFLALYGSAKGLHALMD